MKRIIPESEIVSESLKPVFNTSVSFDQAPFYDPNDLHVHNWTQGKLGLEEDPKVPTFSKNKLNVKNCVYCKLCHKIKLNFQGSVSSNRDCVKDALYDVFASKFEEAYEPETNTKRGESLIIIGEPESQVMKRDFINEKLFTKIDKIEREYVIVNSLN
jgi:hypothetical protein